MKWWPRYPGDFGAKTRHLSLLERGAYDALLDHYYSHEEPLPASMEEVLRIAGARKDDEERAVRRVVAEFFPLNGDGKRHNKRADEEIKRSRLKSKSRRSAALKRWNSASE